MNKKHSIFIVLAAFATMIISSIISLILISVLLPFVNYVNIQMAKGVMPGAVLIMISPLMIIETIFTSFAAMLFAVLIPTIKLGHMKPIDVIRKV